MDANIVQVALSGLENILKTGDPSYPILVEECYGEFEESSLLIGDFL
jgi:hypothetical protein